MDQGGSSGRLSGPALETYRGEANRICGLVRNEWERQRAVKDDSLVLGLMARKPESHGLRQK